MPISIKPKRKAPTTAPLIDPIPPTTAAMKAFQPIIMPMGMMIGWKAFIAAVVGGIGSIRGAVVGAFLLGLIEIGTGAIFPSRLRDLISFVVVWTILMIKPTGFFGVARRQKV